MTPFLYNVASSYYKQYGAAISRFTFVFPNRRAALFFQKYLSEISKKPIFSPEILTIADLFSKLSGLGTADRIEQLFILYDEYQRLTHSSETFDEFLFWGEMLLNDFDDVDKYLVDAQQLFANIQDLKEIDSDFSYLTEDQIIAIRRFWSNFIPIGDSVRKKEFIEMWQILYQLYQGLRSELLKRGVAYEGMIFREVAERARNKSDIQLPFERIVFVGLNGHSTSEEELLKYLHRTGIADFYWDYSSELVKDVDNKASYFIARNKSLFPSKLTLDAEELSMEKPVIEVVGIPSAVGQAKYVHTILESLVDNNHLGSTDQEALNTVVVLPDENLLLPTLYSIPEQIDKINVTMGYNLSNSSIAGLMEHIFELHRNVRFQNNQVAYYYRYVLFIINHRYIFGIIPEIVQQLREYILQNNKVIVTISELMVDPLLELIFSPINHWSDVSAYLKAILSNLERALSLANVNQEEDNNTRSIDMEREFIIEYYKTINKMQDALSRVTPEMSVETYFKLLKKLIVGISVPFSGEPLAGLQIMGVLETRALDFENLIILSMNEGIFPMKKAANSFVPYNLRRGFGLPTYEHQDSIFAYHFYRLINRAKRIYLLYDTRSDGVHSGEVSRYFYQLKYLYADYFDIKQRLAVYEVSTGQSVSITIPKTPAIISKLTAFLTGERSLSASAINTYLDCPLQFYFSVVEQMHEQDQIAETVEADTFGSIFHSVMEWLYRPLEDKMITADILRNIIADERLLTETIEYSFSKNYFKSSTLRKLTGQNFLTGEIIRRYVKKVLRTDIKLTPFVYVQSEKRIVCNYPLPSGRSVSIKGFIDRIDQVAGRTRIIDYKSGKGVLQFGSIDQLFDKTSKIRAKAVMQVFMYAHLYLLENPTSVIEPGIYYLRNLFETNFSASVEFKENAYEKVKVTDFATFRDEFKDAFDACLDEIFDINVPFTQTTTGKPCQWCEFANICKK